MSYSEAMVESLLISTWDRTYAWGIQSDVVADPDMPKAKYKSPKEATTFWTHLIDIRMAWAGAPLTIEERRALILRYGLGMEQREIAYNQLVSQQSINKRLKSGVKVMADWLNADVEQDENLPALR